MWHMANEFTEGARVMFTAQSLASGIQGYIARWLVKGPGANLVIAGTFAFAGLGAAALNAPPEPRETGDIGISTLSVMYPGCYADPDGDGHIFCDSNVTISNLPASCGTCSYDYDGGVFCDGGQGR